MQSTNPENSENSDDDNDEEEDEDPNDNIQASLSNISFGALAKAQESLGPKKKKKFPASSKPLESSTNPFDDVRARIHEIREQKRQKEGEKSKDKDSSATKKKFTRTSKHAPTIQSSKYAVSRKRTVIEPPPVPKARDPRFDPTVQSHSRGSAQNPTGVNKAYSFLDDYRAAELKELKDKYSKTKDAGHKEELKRAIRSASDRMRSIQNKKRESEILAEHKKREKQLLREGKKSQPYYLKKSELKQQVLTKKYEEMKSKDRAKALERRRKKLAAKERKDMPLERRGVEDRAPGDDSQSRKRRRVG